MFKVQLNSLNYWQAAKIIEESPVQKGEEERWLRMGVKQRRIWQFETQPAQSQPPLSSYSSHLVEIHSRLNLAWKWTVDNYKQLLGCLSSRHLIYICQGRGHIFLQHSQFSNTNISKHALCAFPDFIDFDHCCFIFYVCKLKEPSALPHAAAPLSPR